MVVTAETGLSGTVPSRVNVQVRDPYDGATEGSPLVGRRHTPPTSTGSPKSIDFGKDVVEPPAVRDLLRPLGEDVTGVSSCQVSRKKGGVLCRRVGHPQPLPGKKEVSFSPTVRPITPFIILREDEVPPSLE